MNIVGGGTRVRSIPQKYRQTTLALAFHVFGQADQGEREGMGNSVTLAIFGLAVLVCVAIVLYSLFGGHRSILVAIPTAIVFVLAIAPQVINPGGAGWKLQFIVAAAAAMGTVRQFQRVVVDGVDVGEGDER